MCSTKCFSHCCNKKKFQNYVATKKYFQPTVAQNGKFLEKEYGKNIFKMKLKLFLENQKQSFNFKFPDKLELKC